MTKELEKKTKFMGERWYDKSIEQIEAVLETDRHLGLTHAMAKGRLRKYGYNSIYKMRYHSFLDSMKRVISDCFLLLFLLLSVLGIVYDLSYVSSFSFVICIVSEIIILLAYHKSQKIFYEVEKLSLPNATVIREGKAFFVKVFDVVIGDVFYLSQGDIVPCDARLVSASDLKVLEPDITGNTASVKKDPDFVDYSPDLPFAYQENMLWAGTVVTKGTGMAIACATGKNTILSKMKKEKSISKSDSFPIFAKMQKWAKILNLALLALLFLSLLVMLFLNPGMKNLFHGFYLMTVAGVAALSETLPLFASIFVSGRCFSALDRKTPLGSGAVIKNIASLDKIQNLSCIILPEKTAFTVRSQFINKFYDCERIHYAHDPDFYHYGLAAYTTAHFSICEPNVSMANQAHGVKSTETDTLAHLLSQVFSKNGFPYPKYRPIEHVSKGESSLFETGLVYQEGKYTVHVHGTYRSVLQRCTTYRYKNRTYPLTETALTRFLKAAETMSFDSSKIIAFASKETIYNHLGRISACQSELCFEGMLSYSEPVLDRLQESIRYCQSNHLKVILFAADENDSSIVKFAKIHGIIESEKQVFTAKDFLQISLDQFRHNIEHYRVYRGLNSSQKRLLLKYLHQKGEVVGVLGTELDDISLMNEADVCITQRPMLMAKKRKEPLSLYRKDGIEKNVKISYGSDALKFVSDIMITEPEEYGRGGFNGIVNAIRCSVDVMENIATMFRYLFSMAALKTILCLFSIFSPTAAISPIQVLVLGMVFDVMGVLFITFLKRRGRAISAQDESFHHRNLFLTVLHSVLGGSLGGVLALFGGFLCLKIQPLGNYTTNVFFIAAVLHLFYLWESMDSKIWKDRNLVMDLRYLFYGLAFLIIMILLFIIPGLRSPLVPGGISVWMCLFAFAVGFLVILIKEIGKFIQRKSF